MQDVFDKAFGKVVGLEGRYSNNPDDSGGETMYGITVAVARANGYSGPISEMPLDTAKSIYRRQYWDQMRLDEIAIISEVVAGEMFDTGVNMGIVWATQFLQKALTELNRRGKDYPDLFVDGVMGPVTVHALQSYFHTRPQGITVLMRALEGQQVTHYIEIAASREKDEDFLYGWLQNRISLS